MTNLEIQDEIDRLNTMLDDLGHQKAALERKISPATKERDHFLGILEARGGNAENSAMEIPASLRREEPASSIPATTKITREYGEKARSMRDFILARNSTGVTMQEIIEHAKKLSDHPAYAYQFVNRQRHTKRLEKRGKRFYATEQVARD